MPLVIEMARHLPRIRHGFCNASPHVNIVASARVSMPRPYRRTKPMRRDPTAAEPSAPTQECVPVIDIRDVSLTFETADGKVEALAKVDLQVAAGDFVSFIGPSGCGKTRGAGASGTALGPTID
jgi:ABC-type glutathione transport system ATPase component